MDEYVQQVVERELTLLQAEFTTSTGERQALRSSTWVRQDDEWLLLFHRGTPADPEQD